LTLLQISRTQFKNLTRALASTNAHFNAILQGLFHRWTAADCVVIIFAGRDFERRNPPRRDAVIVELSQRFWVNAC